MSASLDDPQGPAHHVDELDHGSCVVCISSEFDVRTPAERESGAARFEAVYAAMFKGYIAYFATSDV